MPVQAELFAKPPRRKPRKLMHVSDAGNPYWFEFTCSHCGYTEDFSDPDLMMSDAKRGIPCPKCAKDTP